MPTHGYAPGEIDSRPNTRPMFIALLEALGGGVIQPRPAGRILETAHTTIIHGCNEAKPPPTLDTMAIYAKRALGHGVKLTFSYDPDKPEGGQVTYQIRKVARGSGRRPASASTSSVVG